MTAAIPTGAAGPDVPAAAGTQLVRVRLDLRYDGTDFAGWAAQPGLRTVQGTLEEALRTVLRLAEPARLTVAGRTDAGVHALAQVASYDGVPAAPHRLNGVLPPDISALGCTAASPGFSARHDATSRAYEYRVFARRSRDVFRRGRVLWWPHRLDLDLLQQCAVALRGIHDFTAFTPSETKHVRFEREIFSASWRREGDDLVFAIEADAFMRHMNRVLVGTMLEVGGGRRSVASFVALLEGAPRSAAGRTAPAHGLYLVGVGYDGRPALGDCRPIPWRVR